MPSRYCWGCGELLANHLFAFAEETAAAMMVPRAALAYVDASWSRKKILEVAESEGYTRFPLCDGGKDHVMGFIATEELIRARGGGLNLGAVCRPVAYVPEDASAADVFRQLILGDTPMTIVLDEFGRLVGLVTLQDVLERIVGNYQDGPHRPNRCPIQGPMWSAPRLFCDTCGRRLPDGASTCLECAQQV